MPRKRKPAPAVAPAAPLADRAPRLSDFLTPVDMLGGVPVYSLPTDPDEMARLVARRIQAQREWEARQSA